MRRFCLLFLCVGIRVFAESIEVDTSRFGINASNHTLFTNAPDLVDPGQSPSVIRSETHLRAETGRFSLGTILSNRFALQNDGSDVPLYLEKIHLTFETEQWQLTAGDTHLELGRGIALALFRDDTFGIDNTLQGASVKFAPEGWEFQATAGRIRTLRTPVTLLPFQNPLFERQVFAAAGVVKRRWSETQLGAHYLLTQNYPDDAAVADKRWHTVGTTFSADAFAPGWDAYVESNVMLRQRIYPTVDNLPTGYGSYGSVVYSPVPSWKLKLEGRDYRNYAYDFHRPPTMEEDIVTSLNFNNITAAKFSAERRMGIYHSIRASLLAGNDRVVKTNVQHAVLSGKWKVAEVGFEARSGYRWMNEQSDLIHGDIKAKIPTLSGQFAEIGYRKLYGHSNLNFLPTLDDRNFFDFGYTFSSHWSLSAGVEYVPSNPVAVGQMFYNVGTLVKFDSFTSRAFLGSTSGGPQCSGGICRLVPPYSGVMLEGTYAF